MSRFSLDDIGHAAEKARATVYTVIPGHQILGRPMDELVAIERKNIEEFLARSPLPGDARNRLARSMMTKESLESAARNRVQMQSALADVATSTGGWTMFLEKPDDADRIYSSIFSDINRRYIVGYYPINKEHDGKRRKLEMSVDHPTGGVGRKWRAAVAGSVSYCLVVTHLRGIKRFLVIDQTIVPTASSAFQLRQNLGCEYSRFRESNR